MTLRSAYRTFFAILLVIVVIVPGGVKVTHHWFVDHEQFHVHQDVHNHAECDSGHHTDHHADCRKVAVVDKEHKRCPICEFHFVEFFSDENPCLTGRPNQLSDYLPALIQQEIYPVFLFRFHLRGPPHLS